jgi:N-acetylmuramic acid 6-phosphate etherase
VDDSKPPEAASAASPSRWAALPTEGRHAASTDLDLAATEDVVRLLIEEDQRGLAAAARCAPEIARLAESAASVFGAGGTIVFLGAGTSGRLGFLEAAECPPTFGTDPERIRAVTAGGRDAVFAAREGAEDSAFDGAEAARGLTGGDLLVGISASSVTPFVLGALRTARERGVATALVTCADAAAAAEARPFTDHLIALATGPEVLTGSTRLKAGSATKAVLNAITTAAMVRRGKVFENFMVDLRRGSSKLRDRAIRIVAAAGRVDVSEAARLLDAADGEVKTAVVAARAGVPMARARALLDAGDGFVRRALDQTNS